jgi:O-antigen/teichoic acid export membrane protein
MNHWFEDRHFRSLLKNTGYLGLSKIVAALASVATLAFAGRDLGLVLFGTLILITSYTQAAVGLSKFQSWQLVVRYGGHGIECGHPQELKAAAGFALALDILGGFGGLIAAVLVLLLIARWTTIQQQYLWLAIAYCTSMPIVGAGTANGLLRVLDRFDLISWSTTVTPVSRAMLAGAAFVSHSLLATYVALWYVTEVGGSLCMWLLAWRELRRRGLLGGIRPTLKPLMLPRAWRFAIHIYLTTGLSTVWGPIARLVVGGVLGAAGTALFRVASGLADAGQKPASLLAQAFYPEVVRMDFSTKKPWKLMLRGTALASGGAVLAILLLLIGGKPFLSLLFGEQFVGAYAPLVTLMAVPFLGVFSFALTPMLYALGRSDGPLIASLLGSAVFLASIVPLSRSIGVVGAAMAFVLGNAIYVSVMMFQLRRERRRVFKA